MRKGIKCSSDLGSIPALINVCTLPGELPGRPSDVEVNVTFCSFSMRFVHVAFTYTLVAIVF